MKKILLFILLFCTAANAQFIAMTAGGQTDSPPFEFTILTLEADDTFTPPLYDGGTYDFVIDWGDLSSSTITSFNDEDLTHTYADEGATEYSISISGTLIGWKFDNAGDKTLMKDISQWGCFRPGNTGDTFKGCSNLTISATDRMNLSGVTDINEMFQLCGSLTTIPNIGTWDVSNVTSFYGMFHSDVLFTGDISTWDVHNCQNFGYMFYHCDVFNVDLSGWNTESATQMTWMFYEAAIFNRDVGDWDVGGVSNFDQMFRGALAFDQDLSGWDITGMTSASAMFLNVTLSTSNYDALLIGWEAQTEQAEVIFGAGNSQYSAGAAATAKGVLETTSLWVITDGGQEE